MKKAPIHSTIFSMELATNEQTPNMHLITWQEHYQVSSTVVAWHCQCILAILCMRVSVANILRSPNIVTLIQNMSSLNLEKNPLYSKNIVGYVGDFASYEVYIFMNKKH
jgi:hypothetical protein